jgi:hypothetical protein
MEIEENRKYGKYRLLKQTTFRTNNEVFMMREGAEVEITQFDKVCNRCLVKFDSFISDWINISTADRIFEKLPE